MLIDPTRLGREYFERKPELDDPGQLVSFGTSGSFRDGRRPEDRRQRLD
jgi:hypothetical protein